MARERRTAFGEVADLYDRARPSYPQQLVDDVIELVEDEDRPWRALEVGAGTGKATVLFARCGVTVHALEPLADMAALAEHNCRAYEHVEIERAEFESWDSAGASFGLLFSAQAWHWIDEEVRYGRAHRVLAPGGVLAAFWNRVEWDVNPLHRQIDEVYGRVAPEVLQSNATRAEASVDARRWWEEEIDGAAGFEQPEVRIYRWDTEYSSREYVQLLSTHSDHIVLDPRRADQLYARIAGVIDDHGGALPVTYSTRLCLAKAKRATPG